MYHPQNFGLSMALAGREDLERRKDLSYRNQLDFKHKESLWMDSREIPSLVQDKLCIRTSSTPDGLSPSLLWTCSKNKDLSRGIRIHHELQKKGLVEKNYADVLIIMYAKCGQLQKAQALLDMHNSSNIIAWNALIASYTQEGQGHNALDCFKQMKREGIPPNAGTYVCILKACAVIGAIDKGKKLHDDILRQGLLEHDVVLGGALVDMYAKCGALPKAQSVLQKLPSRNVVSWTALISGYAQKKQGHKALDCYKQMKLEGILPNAVTYVCILKACAVIGNIEMGKQIHNEISRQALLEKNSVLGAALVDMYAKCDSLPQAQKVLKKLPFRDVVSWSALISGYAQKGQGPQAFECFEQMQREGIRPNAVTYVSILKACAVLGAIKKGKQIHKEISRQGLLEHSIVLGGALVDMYAKCGDLLQAQSVLEKLPSRNVVSWNALIAGYAQEGHGEQALKCFEQMQCEGILPDMVTFSCLLNLCNHLGLVGKGQELFDLMEAAYGLKPDIECFASMVDLLGRAGHLVKAVELIQEMPFAATSAIWLCLLGACRERVDVNVGTWAFEQARELGKCNEAAYVLMANIYAAAGMTEKAKDVEARMKAVRI